MNPNTTQPPPPIEAALDPGEIRQLIAVSLQAPTILHELDGGLMAVKALHQALNNALRMEGQHFQNGHCWGRFSRAIIFFHVSDWQPAFQVIKRELAEIGLLSHSRIGYFDQAELYWRAVYPDDGIPFAPLVDFEWINRELTERKAELEAWIKRSKPDGEAEQ